MSGAIFRATHRPNAPLNRCGTGDTRAARGVGGEGIPGGLGGAGTVSEALVQAGEVHYFGSDAQGFIGSTAANSSIAYVIGRWVASHFTAHAIGGVTVYELSS